MIMEKQDRIRYSGARILLCLTLLFVSWLQLAAAGSRTLRVGYYMFDGYQMEDDNKVRSGYGYDFLQELARYTDWNYEYVGYHLGWARLQQMLDAGEIDILTSARKTPAREGKYLFSTEIGTSAGILTVKSGNEQITLGDYSTYQGMRIGMIKDSSINENFARFAAKNGIGYTPVYYENVDQMNAALQAGTEIDAVCTTNLRRTQNEWIIAQFDVDQFYVMMRGDNLALQQDIDQAIAQMDIYTPGWRVMLWDRYYKPDVGVHIAMTQEEKSFLDEVAQQHRVFTVLVSPDNAPYSYFEDGEAKGIIPEVFREIARRTGLQFNILEMVSSTAYQSSVRHAVADVCMDMVFDYDMAEKAGYKLTTPYLTMPISKVTHKNAKGSSYRAALLQDSNIARLMTPLMNAGWTTQYYPSQDRCIEAVLSQSADAAFMYPYTAQRYLEGSSGAELSVTLLPQHMVSFALGVMNQDDPRLLSILNKAAASVSKNYTNQVILRHMATQPTQVTVSGFLAQHPYARPLGIGFAILLVVAIAVGIDRQRNLRIITEKNTQLAEAVRQANEANTAKSVFLSGISHDMRTPLNGILGFTRFALAESDPAKKQMSMEKVEQAGKILLDLINNTLEVSRIESGKFVLEPDWVHTRTLIDSVVSVIQDAADRKQQQLVLKVDCPADEYAWIDRLKMQEIFLNLLSNAVKYTPEGGRIELCTERLTAAGGVQQVRIIVRDNGIGISEAFQPRVFDAFAQERSQKLKNSTGTGLGLSIVKRIVDLMDGRITLVSQEGVGSTFTVELSIRFERREAEEAQIQPDKSLKVLVGKKILLCEDNELNIEIAQILLREKGMEVTVAEDGGMGCDLFVASAEDEYAAILMDIHMPVMDGYEVTRAIRSSGHPRAASVPIIAMTADAYAEDVQKCLAAGMNAHIAKPIDPAVLYQTLSKAVQHEQAVVLYTD